MLAMVHQSQVTFKFFQRNAEVIQRMYKKLYTTVVDNFDRFFAWMYDDYDKWLILPALMLILAFAILGYSYTTTGTAVPRGIEFTGGTEIQIQVGQQTTTEDVETALQGQLDSLTVRELSSSGDQRWLLIQTMDELDADEAQQQLDQAGIAYEGQVNVFSIGAAVSQSFLRDAQMATLLGFFIMSVVIFIAFRSIVPSVAVILAAFTDIIVSLAGMSLLGIDLTLGTIAALLMLIGYSVDTDIVLSTRVLRQRKRDLRERVRDSITTGMTMTGGAIVAFTVLLLISTSPTLDQIASVIMIGLIADIPATWTGNAILIKMHAEGRI
jgi:preprotein translocase subunit SecF